ncbi:hypothetical protein BF28_6005 (plasmid) [Bacillus cereus E33L]|nr:hypothetical protein BF28_6005 [Bacillus cereus E33L]
MTYNWKKWYNFRVLVNRASYGITMVISKNVVFDLVGDSYDLYKYI